MSIIFHVLLHDRWVFLQIYLLSLLDSKRPFAVFLNNNDADIRFLKEIIREAAGILMNKNHYIIKTRLAV